MSKNMTQKGLAIGASATLAFSLLGTAPASAAGLFTDGYVSLLPSSGTAYATLSSEAFDLKSNVVGSLAGTADKNLKFLIEDSDELIAVDVDVDAAATAVEAAAANVVTAATAKSGTLTTLSVASHGLEVGDAIHVTTAAAAGLDVGYYTVTAVPTAGTFTIDTRSTTAINIGTVPVYKTGDADDLDSRELIARVAEADADTHFGTASIPAVTGETDGRNADGSFVVDTETNSNAVDRVLRLVNTDATKTTTVKVTAWVDDNDDNDIDPTEYVSATRSITFHKTSDLTVTTALTTPVIGDASINGTISITPELNGQQIRTSATAGVWATSTLQSGTANDITSVTYNTVTKVWDLVIADDNNVEVGTFTAKAEIADVATGNSASVLVTTRVSADTKLVSVATVDQQGAEDTAANDAESNVKVRPTKTATLVATVYDADAVAVGAGKTVNVVLSSATTTTDWFINGVKVLDNAAGATKQYVTDANGQITMAIKSTSGANGDTIIVDVNPEGLSGAAAASMQLTYETASYTLVDVNAPLNGAARNLTKGGSMSLDIMAKDQWNAPMTGDYRLQMTLSGQSDGTDTVGFSSGRATYTFSDEALTAGGSITVATQLQKLTAGVWGNSTDATDLADITVTVSAAPTTSIVVAATYTADTGGDATADTAFNLWEKQIVAHNPHTSQAALVLPYAAASDDTATIAMGAGTGLAAGDTVTVSGAGLWFGYMDNGVVGTGTLKSLVKDSYTFVLDNASDVILVASNTYVKDAVVTVTSRGRSGTVKVSSHVAGADDGAAVNWTVPATAAAGTTFSVTAQLVDAFGNVVNATDGDVSVTYTGPGFVSGSLPTDTNALGVATFSVLLGSADSGTATVTFAYDTNADGDTADLGEFVSTKTITVGAAAAAADTKVNAGSFKGYVAVYAKGHQGKRLSAKIGNDWVVVESLASNFERVVDFTGAGYTIAVRIYIDRVLVDTITVTTK